MGSLWLLVFGLGNLAIVGLWLYMFGLRENPPPDGKPLSRDKRQTLRLLQELTAEVAERAEENAERLEAVARELLEPGELSPGDTCSWLELLQRCSAEQKEFAIYLRTSGETLQQHNTRLGVLPARAKQQRPAEPSGSASLAVAIDELKISTDFDIGTELPAAMPSAAETRRREDREPTSFTLLVLPLDVDFEPEGRPFVAVAREVSTGGMSFSHTSPLSSKYVAIRIRLGDAHDNFLVMDCRHSSSAGPMFITGGAFLSRLEDGPARRMLADFVASSETAEVAAW